MTKHKIRYLLILARCDAGQYISCSGCSSPPCLDTCGTSLQCFDCPFDTYQSVVDPVSTTECIPCQPGLGTSVEGATSSQQCQGKATKLKKKKQKQKKNLLLVYKTIAKMDGLFAEWRRTRMALFTPTISQLIELHSYEQPD